jgi:SAM-dependent methyltransferase
MAKEWFYDWFNSPYYHLLYHKRNDAEAEYFINNLLHTTHLRHCAKVLDIACGRGRHAIYLHKQGFDVTGIDLSIENIRYARQFETPSLHFFVHDMRHLYYNDAFDAALNLFTSFGYFKTDSEHITTLINFRNSLRPNGLFILDYFNCNKIVKNLIPAETKTIDGIDFHISKTIADKKVIKTISFTHQGNNYEFKEIVSLFTLNDFMIFFKQSGFEIISNFGGYGLEKFDIDHSDRLIFICKRSDA